MPTPTTDREIVLTRTFDAPRELVWQAWTDPAHLPRWWGPAGFSTTTHHQSLAPGGEWRYTMHGPDGHDYENLVNYLEVTPPSRLVYRMGGTVEVEPVDFLVTVTFETVGRQTRVTMHSLFPTAQARDTVVEKYGAIEGGKQHLARLAEHLAVQPGGSRPFTISRVFAAPVERVWEMWTDAEHIRKWFGPVGCPITHVTLDLRVGGRMHYAMQPPAGPAMWGLWVYREIVPSMKLVFVSSFANAAGEIAQAPFSIDWPLETLSIVTFAPDAGIGGGTVVTMTATAINPTPAQQKTFDDHHASMRGGWSGTLDQLAAHLAGT